MSTPARILMREGDTTPAAPTDGQILLYAKTSGAFYSLNSAGIETPLGGGASGPGVTSVSASGSNGILVSGSPITSSGTLTFALGAITPASVAATGTISGSNFSGSVTGTNTGDETNASILGKLGITAISGINTGDETNASILGKLGLTSISGTNTGDQTITLTGDVTGSGSSSFVTTLSNTGVTAGSYGSAALIPIVTVDSKGRITGISTTSAATGTVTSVSMSGGTTGLTTTGGPITGTGTITLGGTLSIANGGTGATTAIAARTALLPTQTGNAGRYLITNGTDASWAVVAAPGTGTVTSVGATGNNGITVANSPITDSGSLILGLGNIIPTSVAATGLVTGSNLSGTNTGDQTITLTGDVTGSGTGSFAATLSNSGVAANTYGSATQVPVFTVDAKGRITGVTNTTISAGTGSVTSVAASGGTTGLTFTGSPITTSGTLTLAGTLAIANGGTGATTQSAAANAILPSQTGNTGRYLTTNGTAVSWATVPTGAGTVTSVGVASTTSAISVSNTPITGAGTINLTANNFTTSSPGVVPASSGGTTNFLRADGTWAAPVSGTGTVTSVSVVGTDGIDAAGGPVTNSGTITLSLTDTGVTAGTYGSASNVPVFTVDTNGRISSVTNVPVAGGGAASTSETVVFRYSSGGSGNLLPADAIVSQSPGVTANIVDGTNCIVEFSFTGRTQAPTTILIYGQVFSLNTFALTTPPGTGAAGANYRVAGGGTAANPDIINGIFSPANSIRLQLRMVDVGASAGLGNRAHCLVRFGF